MKCRLVSCVVVPVGCCVFLGGCLPEDAFLGLEFSPDGQLVAIVSEKKGLVIADPAAQENRQIASLRVDPGGVSWTPDSLRVAYASKAEGSLDLYLTALDGMTTRITSLPSRESQPMVAGNKILYLSTESGSSQFAVEEPGQANDGADFGVLQRDIAFADPVLSPDGRQVAVFGFDDLRSQIYVVDVETGDVTQVTSETDPLSLVAGPLTWKPDGTGIGFLRNEVQRSADGDDGLHPLAGVSAELAGTSFCVVGLTTATKEVELFSEPQGIHHPRFLAGGSVVFERNGSLVIFRPDGHRVKLELDIKASCPEPGGDEGEISFVGAGQLLGVTTASLERARILMFDLQDKFLLAEEYFRSGSSGKSYDLYEELAASVQRTRDPQMAKFVYIANLRRLGRTDKAVAEIEKLLVGESGPGDVPEKYLWRLLGFSYLLELNNPKKAEESFRRYYELTSDTLTLDDPDSGHNALWIIEETSGSVAALYGRAVKARLNGNFSETDRLFAELLTTAPEVLAVQREYINALEGFDREVYYFSPSQRPFNPSRSQQADYLERFITAVPDSPLARSARLELFLLRIEMGSFSRARELLSEALISGSDESRPTGIVEVFSNYLETPEPQPWINQAMPEVFLHNSIRPLLETVITSPEDRLLMAVAATKMALLQNAPDRARQEANAALAEWNRLEKGQQTGELAALYGRLLVLRAREAELRGLYSEAAEEYDQALKTLAEKQVDNFEFQEEIRYRAALLRTLVSEYPDMLQRLREIELRTGLELVNPTWEREALAGAVREYVNLYDSTSGTLKLIAANEASLLLSKLQAHHRARSGFAIIASGAAPDFLQRKAMLELAAIDAYVDDPWNAARWFARLAAMPGSSGDVKLWCSFQMARLHLSINYKISAAREALGLIVSSRPNTDLAVQAQELLLSTSTR